MNEPYDCEHGNSCYTCKDCTIKELTAQLAEWHKVFGHLSKDADTAGNMINEGIAERDAEIKYFAEQSLKVVEDLKYLNGCVARGRGSDINTEYIRDNVFQYIKELERQLAEARAEVERLTERLQANAAKIDEEDVVIEWADYLELKAEARKEAARECYEMVFSTIDESKERIAKRFGLEG